MSVPSWWEFALLALGAYRLTRLAGWDDFPLAVRLRAWATGGASYGMSAPELSVDERVTLERQGVRVELGLDAPQEAPDEPGRPFVAHLLACPFCVGWWISLGCYLAWLAWPAGALVAMSPLAISGAVGLVAKNLDP